MLIELIVHEGDERVTICHSTEITVKPNTKYTDGLDILDLLEESIYEALESAGIEVTNE